MSLRINNNGASLNAYQSLSRVDNSLSKSLEKLSTGYRINKAADDASGLVISETLRAQIGGLKVATRNAQDAIGVMQTADGALNETTAILQRMRDLAMHAANTGATDTDGIAADQAEADSLTGALDQIAKSTKFGKTNLLDGSFAGTFVVGATGTGSDVVAISITTSFDTAGLFGGGTTVDLTAAGTVQAIDDALTVVTGARGAIGAQQNRLEHTISNLGNTLQNLSESESRIRDTDMAAEMTNLSKTQILSQSAMAMLGQANSSSQNVLQLLRG